MQINYKMLGEKLTEAGLTGKAVNEYTKDEIHTLAEAIVGAMIPEREGPFNEKPSIDENGVLHIPFNSHPRYWWWSPCGQSITATLTELKASDGKS